MLATIFLDDECHQSSADHFAVLARAIFFATIRLIWMIKRLRRYRLWQTTFFHSFPCMIRKNELCHILIVLIS